MNTLQADRVVKAIVDGVESYTEIATRAGMDPQELAAFSETLDQAIQLLRGFYKYGHENMKQVGLPPPRNLYLDKNKAMDEQSPEYFAFEAIQRNGPNLEKAVFTCSQFGLDRDVAEKAIENVAIPWREVNGWRSYACQNAKGRLLLMDKTPVKLMRHIDRILSKLV